MMKRVKRVLSLLLVCCFVVGLFPISAAAAKSDTDVAYPVEGGNIYFEPSTGTVTDCDETVTEAFIPEEINGVNVTSIGDYAFDSCMSLPSVTIPSSVKSIGTGAFSRCSALTSVTIPSSITSIGAGAFSFCYSLSTINVDSNNSVYISIDGVAFSKDQTTLVQYPAGKSNTSYIIPNSVTNIGDDAFLGCDILTCVSIPSSVTSIGTQAFGSCCSLTDVNIPSSVTGIGDYAFANCENLTSVSIPGSVTYIGKETFAGCNALTIVTILEGVTHIGYKAFDYCWSLTHVAIPSSVVGIGQEAFRYCGKLTIYYAGTQAQWDSIVIDNTGEGSFTSDGNKSLFTATIHYNSTGPDDVANAGQYVSFLSNWDSSTRQAVFDYNEDVVSPYTYTLADNVATSHIDNLLNRYVLATIEPGEGALDWIVTDIQPVESAIGTVTATGAHSLTVDGKEYPVREDHPLGSYDGQEILYHTYNGTIMCFDLLKEKHGILESWNGITGQAVLDGTTYSANYLSDLSFQYNLDEYLQKDVCLLTCEGSDYRPLLRITGPHHSGGTLEDFDVNIYRAKWLNRADCVPVEIIHDTLSAETPSEELVSMLQKTGFDEALTAWEGFDLISSSLNNPTALVDFAAKPKDMYSAILLNALEASVSYDVVNSQIKGVYEDLGSFVSTVTSSMKTLYGIDLRSANAYKSLTAEQQKKLASITSEWFDVEYPMLTTLNDVFSGVSMGFQSLNNIENYFERIVNCVIVANTGEYMKGALRQLYQDSSTENNLYLRLALADCIEIMDSSTEALIAKIISDEFTAIGKDVGSYLIGELLWGEVQSFIVTSCPAIAVFQQAYKNGKYASNLLFSTDDTKEQYLSMLAVSDIEVLVDRSMTKLKQQFETEPTTDHAGIYLSCVDLAFSLRKIDAQKAYGLVDVLDNTWYNKVYEFLSQKDSYPDALSYYKTRESTYMTQRNNVQIGWINSLEADYPGSGLYEKFCNDTENALVKEVTVACPVNVFIYDSGNSLVASVEGNRISCSGDVMAVRDGDRKTIRFFGGDSYTIQLKGYDKGTMDVRVVEFDDAGERLVRTANFYDVPLDTRTVYTFPADSETLEPNAYVLQSEDGMTFSCDYDSLNGGSTYQVSIVSGAIIQDSELKLSTKASAGEQFEIFAYVPEKAHFIKWTSDYGEDIFLDATALDTTVCMPASDVNIQAIIDIGSAPDFTDVSSNAWYYDSVQYVATHGLMNGYGNSKFGPTNNVTRGQFAQIIYNKEGKPTVTRASGFTDVVSGAWYYDAVTWASDNNVVGGYGNGKYGPNNDITREQLATMLWRYAGEPETSGSLGQFVDGSNASNYAVSALKWAVENGIVNGKGNSILDPQGKATRAEVATMLMRYCENEKKHA